MTLLEIESRQVGSAAGQPLGKSLDQPDPVPPHRAHSSALTIVTVAVAGREGEDDEDQDEYQDDGIAAEQLRPLPRLGDLVLTVVQTDFEGEIRRWIGPEAAGAGVPTGPGAILHLQPAASQRAALGERSLSIQANLDRRPSKLAAYRPGSGFASLS